MNRPPNHCLSTIIGGLIVVVFNTRRPKNDLRVTIISVISAILTISFMANPTLIMSYTPAVKLGVHYFPFSVRSSISRAASTAAGVGSPPMMRASSFSRPARSSGETWVKVRLSRTLFAIRK